MNRYKISGKFCCRVIKYTFLLLLQILAKKKEKYEILQEKLCLVEDLFSRIQVRLKEVESTLKSVTAAMNQKQFKVSGNISISILILCS